MGAEADAQARIRRVVMDEALARVGELEEKIAAQKKIVNRQGLALESVAHAITAFATEHAKRLEALEQRGIRAYFRRLVARVKADQAAAPAKVQKLTIRKVTEPAAPEKVYFGKPQDPNRWDPETDAEKLARVKAEYVDPVGSAPVPSHIHQYAKVGALHYGCTVEGCGRRVTLEEMAAESSYLISNAGQKGN